MPKGEKWFPFVLLLQVMIMVLNLLVTSEAIPLQKQENYNVNQDLSSPYVLGVNFLVKYGYLKSSKTTPLLQEISKATRKFQKIYGLKVNGKFDEETLLLMKTPRCGLPDAKWKKLGAVLGKTIVIKQKTHDISESNNTIKQAKMNYKNHSNDKRKARKKRFVVMGKWPRTKITYGFRSYSDDMPAVEQQKVISRALQVWSEGTPLSFEQRWEDDVDVVISFESGNHGDGYPFDGPGNTLAHAFFPGLDERNGDVHFDRDEHWTTNSTEGTSLLKVAIHEFGHALGLGHSADSSSVMLPFYQGRKEDEGLGEDDSLAINYLYKEELKSSKIVEKPPRVSKPPPTPEEDGLSSESVCNLSFDAVVNIRNEIYFFKDDRYWRLRMSTQEKYYNYSVSSFWTDFPQVNVDAVYTRGRNIYIFSGEHFWTFTDIKLDEKAKWKPHYLLPVEGSIDAAFVWNNVNEKTYFLKGSKLWRYDEERRQLDEGYPKDVSEFGLPPNIDGAFTNPDDGDVYFLKGTQSWRLDKHRLKTSKPENIGEKWFGCKKAPVPADEPRINNWLATKRSKLQKSDVSKSSRQNGATSTDKSGDNGTASNSAINLHLIFLTGSIRYCVFKLF